MLPGNSYTFAYTYNASTGMLETYEYPSGYKLKYLYDSRGNQHEVRTADAANTLLWKANAENQRGQLTQATMGNGTITDYEWDTYGFPQRNKVSKGTSSILQNLTFSFNSVTGNLNARSDAKRNILETFDYDNLLKDRLTYWSATNGSAKTMAYASNGNVLKKSDVSTSNTGYLYETAKPNAVTKVVSPTSSFQQNAQPQSITYTSTNKVEHVLNNDVLSYQLHLTYGVDDQRVKSFMNKVTGNPSVPEVMKYYLDNYEYEYRNESYRHLHYLQGPDGLFAIMVQQGTSQSMYYVHKDYLGSITAISDAAGNLVESLSYDPWGRRRNPNNWNDYNVTSTLFDRGFTGHEHLPQFGLINMNGRVYDPFLARFLSPDPKIGNPENGQNFNRYSYALNNPFKYTDPDGENPLIIAAALVGGGLNMISNWQNISKNPWSAIGYFASGAVGGIVAISNPHLGGTIAATGNVATDIAFGNIPDFKKPMDVIQYVGFKALDGLGAASAPKIARSVLNASWLSRNSYKMGGVQYELLAESADEIAYTANISSEVTVLAQKTYTFDGVANSALKIGKNVIAGADEIGNAAKSVTNLVYQGVDKTGVVRYVGITEREAVVRFGEHLSSGTAKSFLRYEVVPGATNLSRTGARVWEQTLINQYGLQKNGGLLLNKINSIAPKNWWQHGINL